ncbi:MAG TPA: winged helix-turn-helix transcriptional regulator, partial [Thermoplasmata archaeon]|nr:winged helix-turn-helix transcriptional regulator [Thermoplasmata archaeon]
VSPATLTATLRALEKERLVRRSSDSGARGSPVRYDLTERGRGLYQRLIPLAGWLRNAEPLRSPYRTA